MNHAGSYRGSSENMNSSRELFRSLNDGMKEERFHAFTRNLDRNIPLIQQHGGLVELPEKLKGKHVIVAAAGISLRDSLEFLKKYYQRREIVLIAVDMALRPLVSRGISPDYVISCETTPTDFFSGIDTSHMHLLAFSCIWSGYPRRWRGGISFYNWQIDDNDYSPLWERAGHELGFVATGSLVTTQAVSIALGCGIASLMLTGNDLAFRDRYYVPGTCREYSLLGKITRFAPETQLQYQGARAARHYLIQRGDAVYSTSGQFLAAKSWLEELFGKVSMPVYDLSSPGCAEKAVIKTNPTEYFSIFDRKRRKKR